MRMSISAAQMHSMLDTTKDTQGQSTVPERKKHPHPCTGCMRLYLLKQTNIFLILFLPFLQLRQVTLEAESSGGLGCTKC